MAFVRESVRTARFMMSEALYARAFVAMGYTGDKTPIARVKSSGALLAKPTLLEGLFLGAAGQASRQSCAHPFFVGPAPPEARFVLTCCWQSNKGGDYEKRDPEAGRQASAYRWC